MQISEWKKVSPGPSYRGSVRLAADPYPILQLHIDRIGTESRGCNSFVAWGTAHTFNMRSWIVSRAAAMSAQDGAMPVFIYICAQLNFFVSYYRHTKIIFDVDAEGPSEADHVQVQDNI